MTNDADFTDPYESRTTPRSAGQADWTVMVYMAAALNAETEFAAIRDIEEMQRIDTNGRVNVIVQIDRQWPGYPERYRVHKGISEPIVDETRTFTGSVDASRASSGNPAPLLSLLKWSREHAKAKHYLLVLWGHNYGLGFGRDHGDALTLWELAEALRTFSKEGTLDLLGANACALSYAEAIYELRGVASYLVASEISMPFAGWPYSEILAAMVADDHVMAPDELGNVIIEQYMKSTGQRDVALTLVNLDRAKDLRDRVRELAGALKDKIERAPIGDQIADAFLDTGHGDVRPLIDLSDLCNNLLSVEDARITQVSERMLSFLSPGALIVAHRSDPELVGLNGVGIFSPAVTGAADLTRLELSEQDYRKLSLIGADSNWATLVYTDLKLLLDEMNKAVARVVRGTGAATREDRMGVSQLLLSLNRAFVKLDGAVSMVKDTVLSILKNPKKDPPAVTMAARGAASATELRLRPRPVARTPELHVVQATLVDRNSLAAEESTLLSMRRRNSIATLFSTLEDALARAERTAKKVLTDDRFGLGEPFKPGRLGEAFEAGGLGEPFKPGKLGEPFKPGKLGEPFKPGRLGEPFKPGRLGLLPWMLLSRSDGAATPGDAMTVAELYGQVALSLYEVEEAVLRLEDVTLGNGAFDPTASEASDSELMTIKRAEQSFRELEAVVRSAKETAYWILSHPSYGLGPGREPSLGPSGRSQLASIGGLSPRNLRLL